MKVSFVRSVGSADRIYVRRSDGSGASWSFPTYGDELPHDLVHLVVEAGFGVPGAIWAAVDAGLDLGRANARANRVGGKTKYAGSGLDGAPVYLSEALANAGWSRAVDDAERVRAIASACSEFALPVPSTVTLDRVAKVRATLDRLRARWRSLVPKGTLELAFDPRAPERSFESFT
jgi:hypothetical protein